MLGEGPGPRQFFLGSPISGREAACLDLDRNLLVRNDPFAGPTVKNRILTFAAAGEPFRLRVRPGKSDPFA